MAFVERAVDDTCHVVLTAGAHPQMSDIIDSIEYSRNLKEQPKPTEPTQKPVPQQPTTSTSNNTSIQDQSGVQESTNNDAISMNALVGTWGLYAGNKTHYYWDFKADGNFSYYRASWHDYTSKNEFFYKGKYRVKDHAIEFYDCYLDSNNGRSWKYFSVGSFLELQYDVSFDIPLINPKKRDDVSMTFEFIDSMRLRFISENGIVWGNFDMVFHYMADSHNVAIPAHRIPVPGLLWPKDKLPPEVLEYESGSIREVDDTSRSREIYIYIERTTREDIIDYGKRLIKSGWERGAFTELLDGTGDALWLDMGKIHLHINMIRDDYAKIAFWYDFGFEKYW
jgi:hypothetical protein